MTGAGASFDVSRARDALAGTRFGDLRWTAETGSTNSDLLALARQGAPEGVVVLSDHQTAGRGRRGRRWDAEPGSALLVSVLLRPPLEPERLGLVPMTLGISAVDAVAEVTGAAVALKWPNDVVTSPAGDPGGAVRKLAGMLAEGDGSSGCLVVGIGVNVTWSHAMATSFRGTATALDRLTGEPVDRLDVLVAMLRYLEDWYGSLVDGDHSSVLDAYRSRSATIGQRVRVILPEGEVVGVASEVTDRGHLILDVAGEGPRTVVVGDVVHLRAEP